MKTSFTFDIPTKYHFGAGMLKRVHELDLPGKKALIITTANNPPVISGYVEILRKEMAEAGVESVVYDQVSPNPTVHNVNEAAALARANSCDFVCGLGGGSAIDCTKATAFAATNEGDFWDYTNGRTGGGKEFTCEPLPIMAVPTTAATGTEIDPWFVITNPETHEKDDDGCPPGSYPALSVVDPELMLTVPPRLTAFQGFDVLFHASESGVSPEQDIFSEMFSMEALRHVGQYLVRAVKDGSDLEARTHMALASSLAAFYMNGTSEHPLEHELSAYHPRLPHGAGLLMIGRAYWRTIASKGTCDDAMIRMAGALGMEKAASPYDFVVRLEELMAECGVDDLKMSDYGITPEEFPKMVEELTADGSVFEMDVAPLTAEDLLKIYKESYQ